MILQFLIIEIIFEHDNQTFPDIILAADLLNPQRSCRNFMTVEETERRIISCVKSLILFN